MLVDRLLNFFASLRLTVVLLAFAIVLVFIGTLAQVDEGLYNAQARYFRQWLIPGVDLLGWRIPVVLPGGYLIGTLLLINLVTAHVQRFQFTLKKTGLQLAHAGVILLLVGQLATDMFSRETQIHFAEGETKSYSESPRFYELAFTTAVDANTEEVTVIPDRRLEQGGKLIRRENLPFTIRVKSFWRNSEPTFRAPMMHNGPPLTTNGIAVNFDFSPRPEVKTMDDKNAPTALIEITGPENSLGEWIVSGWTADESLIETLKRSYEQQAGPQMAGKIVSRLTEPQSVRVGGKTFTFALRPARLYHPFSLTLLKATHTVYPGTDIPKDFRSRVRLANPRTGENREVEIYMNRPLRYAGLTFYQYQMDAGEMAHQAGHAPSSVLQVVRNPGWLTPYIGCAMVAIGLVIQFTMHLVGFVSKRRAG
jgi:hypothetical protein